MVDAEIICDSLCNGYRITTLKIVYPRIILAEVNTHGASARNTASSRAVPHKKMVQRIKDAPFIPEYIGKNKSGMQSDGEISEEAKEEAIKVWLDLRDKAIDANEKLAQLEVHKEIANRVLETWLHVETVITATEWDNFFTLRRNKDAQPQFQALANEIKIALDANVPKALAIGDWHLPFITEKDRENYSLEECKKISTARCARVSYFLQEGGLSNPEKDLPMCEKLISSGHYSPLEHPAKAVGYFKRIGRYVGWCSLRHTLPNDCNGDYTIEKYRKLGAVIDAPLEAI